jgi:hypothetical protein
MRYSYQPAKIYCPYCSVLILPQRLAKHIRRKHAGQPIPSEPAAPVSFLPKTSKKMRNPVRAFNKINARNIGTCPMCNKTMAKRLLEGHLNLHEQAKNKPLPPAPLIQQMSQHPDEQKVPDHSNPAGEEARKQEKELSSYEVIGVWYRDSEGESCFGILPAGQLAVLDTKGHQFRKPLAPLTNTPRVKKISISDAIQISGEPIVTCPYCRRSMSVNELQSHIKSHPELMQCPVCDTHIRKLDFSVHMTTVHQHWCPICRGDVPLLHEHIKIQHNFQFTAKLVLFYQPDWREKKILRCGECKRVIALNEISSHESYHKRQPEVHTVRNNVLCPVCNKRILEEVLQSHINVHHPTCPYCQKQMKHPTLKYHIERKHSGKAVPD